MITAEDKAREICMAIGQRIRSIRQGKRMTLDLLAKRTGFAKSYLSQIETLKREPPISTLTKIAYVLGVDTFFLISGEAKKKGELAITIVRANERTAIPRPSGSPAYIYEPISDKKKNRSMDGYVITVGPNFPPEPLIHEGEEIACVLEGRQELVYDGTSYVLDTGDCYHFDSNKLHYSRSLGNKPAKLLVVFTSNK